MATYYVDGSMTDDTGDGSIANPKKYISSGTNLMSAGDTLIVADGVYTATGLEPGTHNRVAGWPSGNAVDGYTTIKAETDFGVTLENTGSGNQEPIGNYYQKSYAIIRGFHVKQNSNIPAVRLADGGSHIKIIRCSSEGGNIGSDFSGWDGSSPGSFVVSYTSYVLFEECFYYGLGRYPFAVGGASGSTSSVIFRRCVVRWDGSQTHEPQAAFAPYEVGGVYYQNCIAIDGKDIKSADSKAGGGTIYIGMKGFYILKRARNISMQGCMVLNFEGAGYFIENQYGDMENVLLEDSVAWDLITETDPEGYSANAIAVYGTATSGEDNSIIINRTTLGQSDVTSGGGLTAASGNLDGAYFKNSIIYGMPNIEADAFAEERSSSASAANLPSDYISYYAINGNREKGIDGGTVMDLGANSLGVGNSNAVDPMSVTNTSLKYLTQIESGGTLKTAGEAGGQIGAQILYKIGVDGTLYGEEGWDTVTENSLWPFPNEDIIRTKSKAYYVAAGSLAGDFVSCTFDASTDVITAVGHGFTDNKAVTFRGDTLPEPLRANKAYYTRDVTEDTFKICIRYTTSGYTAIDITSTGANVTFAPGWDNPVLDGDRGFCASTTNPRTDTGEVTLTSYIWEYLGNEIPADIYEIYQATMYNCTLNNMEII